MKTIFGISMRLAILIIFLLALAGCSGFNEVNTDDSLNVNSTPDSGQETKISGTQDLVLNENDLQALGLVSNGTCTTEEHVTHERAPLAQTTRCNLFINRSENQNDTRIVLILKKYTNFHDLNGSYQYSSLHLSSSEGLISEDEYGDMSRFRVNSEHDYGGEHNKAGVYYYHLWIVKDLYLIHVTSKGIEEDKEYIAKIGERIMSKFEQ